MYVQNITAVKIYVFKLSLNGLSLYRQHNPTTFESLKQDYQCKASFSIIIKNGGTLQNV